MSYRARPGEDPHRPPVRKPGRILPEMAFEPWKPESKRIVPGRPGHGNFISDPTPVHEVGIRPSPRALRRQGECPASDHIEGSALARYNDDHHPHVRRLIAAAPQDQLGGRGLMRRLSDDEVLSAVSRQMDAVPGGAGALWQDPRRIRRDICMHNNGFDGGLAPVQMRPGHVGPDAGPQVLHAEIRAPAGDGHAGVATEIPGANRSVFMLGRFGRGAEEARSDHVKAFGLLVDQPPPLRPEEPRSARRSVFLLPRRDEAAQPGPRDHLGLGCVPEESELRRQHGGRSVLDVPRQGGRDAAPSDNLRLYGEVSQSARLIRKGARSSYHPRGNGELAPLAPDSPASIPGAHQQGHIGLGHENMQVLEQARGPGRLSVFGMARLGGPHEGAPNRLGLYGEVKQPDERRPRCSDFVVMANGELGALHSAR